MAYLHTNFLYLQPIILYTFILLTSNHGNFLTIVTAQGVPPSSTRLTSLFPHLSFDRDYSQIFGDSNAQIYANGSNAKISLDKKTGNSFHVFFPLFPPNSALNRGSLMQQGVILTNTVFRAILTRQCAKISSLMQWIRTLYVLFMIFNSSVYFIII